MRVVAHHPLRRYLMLGVFGLICLAGMAGSYWLGESKAGLDRTYIASLETINRANVARLAELNDSLVDAGLRGTVDRQAAEELRLTIKDLRDEVAAVTEEVTFYKSLMSPSSLARGLQIAEFDVATTEEINQFTYHLLLTQVESRRDWIQGDIRIEVRGHPRDDPSAAEQVLSLTEIADPGSYPLKFRFRYLQDLSGVLTLPLEFEPESVVIAAKRRGASTGNLERTFAWTASF
ncbi:MAG: DUF6776 family protein [Pseudomonadales bacterium]